MKIDSTGIWILKINNSDFYLGDFIDILGKK